MHALRPVPRVCIVSIALATWEVMLAMIELGSNGRHEYHKVYGQELGVCLLKLLLAVMTMSRKMRAGRGSRDEVPASRLCFPTSRCCCAGGGQRCSMHGARADKITEAFVALVHARQD